MKKEFLSSNDCYGLAESVAWAIVDSKYFNDVCRKKASVTLYGIPRGGVSAMYLVMVKLRELLTSDFQISTTEDQPDFIIDDIVDSGKTKKRILTKYKIGDERFFALIINKDTVGNVWYVFPWEGTESQEKSAEDIPLRFLQYIGENPERDGLRDTPARVVRTWHELYAGYSMNPDEILGRVFDNEEKYDEMVILRDVEFYSTCEHHLLPFYGKVHIAYLPGEKVVGVSKLARLVECFARRLQIQERLTKQIADAIENSLQPAGVAVLVEAQHFCMTSRGVQKQNSIMVTSALKGKLKGQDARIEFLLLRR